MIRAVIFDLGGTLVDKYSLSPLINLKNAFLKNNVRLSDKLIARDMGMDKFDHITHLSYDKEFRDQFIYNHGRLHSSIDLNNIYDDFCNFQERYLHLRTSSGFDFVARQLRFVIFLFEFQRLQ